MPLGNGTRTFQAESVAEKLQMPRHGPVASARGQRSWLAAWVGRPACCHPVELIGEQLHLTSLSYERGRPLRREGISTKQLGTAFGQHWLKKALGTKAALKTTRAACMLAGCL